MRNYDWKYDNATFQCQCHCVQDSKIKAHTLFKKKKRPPKHEGGVDGSNGSLFSFMYIHSTFPSVQQQNYVFSPIYSVLLLKF